MGPDELRRALVDVSLDISSDVCAEAKIDDLDSVAQYHSDLMRQIDLAAQGNNLTAVAALMRLRGQAIGVLQEKTIVTDERALPDSALIERLAKGDPHKAAMLKTILGDADAYQS